MIGHQAKAVVRALLATYALVPANGHAQVRCPQDTPTGDPTQFTVSIGTVTLPVGAFLLVRNGSQLGAIRLTSIDPAATKYEGRSNYESFTPPDKSTSFAGSNVDHQTGDIYIGPTVGVHAVYVHTKGHNQALIGKWKFHFAYPALMDMSRGSFWKGLHDEGFEFAPTSACQVSDIDATDKRLRWFRWDKTTQVTLPLADLPK
jgi:hypothetical protein